MRVSAGPGADPLREAELVAIADALRDPQSRRHGLLRGDRGVVSAIGIRGTIPPEFLDAFTTALGQHRAWERPTATIPA